MLIACQVQTCLDEASTAGGAQRGAGQAMPLTAGHDSSTHTHTGTHTQSSFYSAHSGSHGNNQNWIIKLLNKQRKRKEKKSEDVSIISQYVGWYQHNKIQKQNFWIRALGVIFTLTDQVCLVKQYYKFSALRVLCTFKNSPARVYEPGNRPEKTGIFRAKLKQRSSQPERRRGRAAIQTTRLSFVRVSRYFSARVSSRD